MIVHIYCLTRNKISSEQYLSATKRLHKIKEDYRFHTLLIRILAMTGLAKIAEKCDTSCLVSSAIITAFDYLFDIM